MRRVNIHDGCSVAEDSHGKQRRLEIADPDARDSRIIMLVEPTVQDPTTAWTARKLSHADARREQLLYWRTKSIPECLAAMTALTQRMQALRGSAAQEQQADLIPRRVRRDLMNL
jgi:hypothetical protein